MKILIQVFGYCRRNDPVDDDDTYWISSNDISRAISKIPAKHILVIADSCYSGTLSKEEVKL